ncbi:hypothetical protein D6C95_02075 [Aureobasidium pullulans]|nr:hypothetical protein D6C95_02075 [Aureobasidium pullulans]
MADCIVIVIHVRLDGLSNQRLCTSCGGHDEETAVHYLSHSSVQTSFTLVLLSKGAFELTTVCPSLPLYTHPTATSSSPSLYRQAVVAQWNGANSCLAPPGSNQRFLVRFTASTAYES